MSKSHLTAISRKTLSRPARYLQANNLITSNHLDYGCGRGGDADRLECDRYDPHYFPEENLTTYESITCSFVLNVIEKESDRKNVLKKLKSLLKTNGSAYITVRREIKKEGHTSKGTYQKNIVLDLPIVREDSQFCIYRLDR